MRYPAASRHRLAAARVPVAAHVGSWIGPVITLPCRTTSVPCTHAPAGPPGPRARGLVDTTGARKCERRYSSTSRRTAKKPARVVAIAGRPRREKAAERGLHRGERPPPERAGCQAESSGEHRVRHRYHALDVELQPGK